VFEKIEESIPVKVDFRFCTEALIKNSSIDNKSLLTILERYGNSIVVAGSDRMSVYDLHTNNPADFSMNSETRGLLHSRKPMI